MELPDDDDGRNDAHPEGNSEKNEAELHSERSVGAHASDTDKDYNNDTIVQMAHRVAASLDFASQGLRESEVSAPRGHRSSTSTSQSQMAHSSTQQGNIDTHASHSHAEGVATRDGEICVGIRDRNLLSLFFSQGPSAPPHPNSSGHLGSSENLSEEEIWNYEGGTVTHSHREEEIGTQAHSSGASVLTPHTSSSVMEEGATAAYGIERSDVATDSQVEAGVEWTPGPRIERPDYDEILGLRRLMRPSRRSRVRQRIEELFSVYVNNVSSRHRRMKVKDLPVFKINEEHAEMKCSVCLVEFIIQEEVHRLDCSHIYHKNCIVPWLELSGNCPLCRKTVQECTSESGDPQGNLGGDIRLLFSGTDIMVFPDDSSDESVSSFSDSSSDTEYSVSYS